METEKKIRRRFDKEFKVQAVSMVVNDGLSKTQVARSLGVSDKSVGDWVKKTQLQREDALFLVTDV